MQAGRPYLANPLNSLFYPANILFLIVLFFRAFNIIIVSKWSLLPARLPELFIPEFFERTGTLQWSKNYWGSALLPEQAPPMLSLYIGAPALFLTMLGGFHRHDDRGLSRHIRVCLLAIAGSSLLLSFGHFLPGFHWLYRVGIGISLLSCGMLGLLSWKRWIQALLNGMT